MLSVFGERTLALINTGWETPSDTGIQIPQSTIATKWEDPQCSPPWKEITLTKLRITPIFGIGAEHGCLVNITLCYIATSGCLLYYVKSWNGDLSGCSHHWPGFKQPPEFDNRVRELIMTLDWSPILEIPDCKTGLKAKFCRVSRALCMKFEELTVFGTKIPYGIKICGKTACVTEYEVCEGNPKWIPGESTRLITPTYQGIPHTNRYEIANLFGMVTPMPTKGGKGGTKPDSQFECSSGSDCFLWCLGE